MAPSPWSVVQPRTMDPHDLAALTVHLARDCDPADLDRAIRSGALERVRRGAHAAAVQDTDALTAERIRPDGASTPSDTSSPSRCGSATRPRPSSGPCRP